MNRQTRFFIGFLLLALLFAGIYFFARPTAVQGEKTITVDVVHQDGSINRFTYRTDAEFLGDVLLEERLVAGTAGPYGLFISEVDGEQAIYETDGAYWALLQDGQYATLGADQTPIADGDAFALVYTIG